MHSNISGMLEGAEIVGLPGALLLGSLSWRTRVGKVGLMISGSFLYVALYLYLFGAPLSFVVSPDK